MFSKFLIQIPVSNIQHPGVLVAIEHDVINLDLLPKKQKCEMKFCKNKKLSGPFRTFWEKIKIHQYTKYMKFFSSEIH